MTKYNVVQCGTLDRILEQKEDINGKIGEILIKSGISFFKNNIHTHIHMYVALRYD